MNRGAGRRLVFRDDADRRCFVGLLSELDDHFGIEVHAYCLMGNHYHVVVRSRKGRLSEAMQWLDSLFTRRSNHFRKVDGPIFRGRFHSVAADRPAHRFVLGTYVHANPTDLGWTRPLATYPWSSLGAYAGLIPNDWLYRSELSTLHGGAESLVAAADLRGAKADRPLQLVSDTSCNERGEIDRVLDALEAMNGIGGRTFRHSQLEAIAAAMVIDDLGRDRAATATSLGVADGAFRVRLSRGRRLRCTDAVDVVRAAGEVLQLVSDTSCNGVLGDSLAGHV